jgi:hypothetical protein
MLHLVGYILEYYYDAQTHKRYIFPPCLAVDINLIVVRLGSRSCRGKHSHLSGAESVFEGPVIEQQVLLVENARLFCCPVLLL